MLSEKQVDYILNDIRRNGIQTEELQLNLLDHICCVIENEMSPENNFDEFYRSVLSRFFKKELKEIQEETDLLLTFKNYYTMKKIMLRSGAVSAVTFILGSIFKTMHWPGAGELFVFAIFVAGFIFLPLFFLIRSKEMKIKKDKFIIGFGALFGILFCNATMFKIMHWPWAHELWFASLVVLFFMFLPLFFFSGIRNPDTKINTIVSSILVVVAGGLLVTLSNTHATKMREEALMIADDQLLVVNQNAKNLNKERYSLSASDSSQMANHTLKTKVEEVLTVIEMTKKGLFEAVNYDNEKSEKIVLKKNIGNIESVDLHFFQSGNTDIHEEKVNPNLKKLKEELLKFKQFIADHYSKSASDILDLEAVKMTRDEYTNTIEWEYRNFNVVPFEVAVRNLNQLSLNIRLIEASCIR